MKRKHYLLYALVVLVGCGALFLIAQRRMQHVLAQTDLNVKPFVFEQAHYTIKDGGEVVMVRETVARSRSRAVVHAGTIYRDGKPAITGLRRIDLPNGFASLVIDSLKAKSSGHKPDATLAASKMEETTAKDCSALGYVTDGEETLAGQRAVRIIPVTDELNRIVLWRLPDYNCETVQASIQKRSSASAEWQTISGSRLIKFVEINPDPALFSGFASYREIPPSQLEKQYADQQGIPLKDWPKCKAADKAADKAYYDANK